MDALSALLDGPRARSAFLLRCSLDPPWSMRIRDEAPLCLIAVLRGQAWIVPDDTTPVRLAAGDLVINRGPQPYTVADDPATATTIVIEPGEHCASLDGRTLAEEMALGVRNWGTGPDGATVLLIGVYQLAGEVSRRLLRALPPMVALTAEDWRSPLVGLLAEETGRDEPGQEAVLDRLLDVVLITALRSWFARPEARAPAWYHGDADPVVGRALRLLHHNPAHPWTVAELAAAAGVSRAALARRFHELVGEPPITFLTGWRLALAADLLREPDATIGAVARQVGYGTPFALSSAFKRVYGLSPRAWRAATDVAR